jgi:hypothetical protein
MKKLLALVLCVMMFVSVLPTSAFANTATVTRDFTRSISNTPLATIASEANANKAIGHAKKNIEYMYGALAADTAVFETVKNMDSTVDSLVKEMFKDAKDLTPALTASVLERNTKLYVKDVLGTSIVNYLDDHFGDFAKSSWTTRTTAFNLNTVFQGAIRGYNVYEGHNGQLYLWDAVGGWQTTTLSLAELNAGVSLTGTLASFAGLTPVGANWAESYDAGSLTYTGKQDAVTGAYLYVNGDGVVFALDDATGNWTMTRDSLRTAANDGATYVNATTVTRTQDIDYDPIKYIETFGKAVNDAFNDKKNAANLQNIMYQMYSAKVMADVADEMQTLRDNIRDWENGDPLLANYHFNEGLFIPYAMVQWNDLPETQFERIPDTIFAP